MNIGNVGATTYNTWASRIIGAKAKNVNDAEKFALEKTSGTQELSETEEMELFKKEFYEELSKINIHRTISNVAINISEDAFKKMKEDPQYKQQILNLLKRDLGSSLAPRNCSAVFTVGSSLKDYRGDSWPVGYDSEFYARSQDSFYKKTSESKKDKQKEMLEDYLEKRRQEQEFMQEMRTKEYFEHKEQQALVKNALSSLPQRGSDLDYEDYAAMGIVINMVNTYAKEKMTEQIQKE